MAKPRGVLGARWGDDAAELATRLGIGCERWEPWSGGGGFESCRGAGEAAVFGGTGHVHLIRRNGRLAGLQVEYSSCGPTLRGMLAEEFDTSDDAQPYQRWETGEVVRLAVRPDGACTLTVAGPEFGKVYAAWVLGQGLGSLSAGMQP